MEVGRAMTEREKLIQLIKAGHEKASDYFHKEAMAILKQGKSYSSKDRTKTFDEFVADALIESSIGDIAEWKTRAEIAERTLENLLTYGVCDCDVSQCPVYDDYEKIQCPYIGRKTPKNCMEMLLQASRA